MTTTTTTSNTIADRMQRLRALRGTREKTLDDVLTVPVLEQMARQQLTGPDYKPLHHARSPLICVPLGDDKAKRKVFAYRNNIRSWNIVYGNGVWQRTGNQQQLYCQPGFNISQYGYGDGTLVDCYRPMHEHRRNTLSSRALAYSPFDIKTSGDGEDKTQSWFLRPYHGCHFEYHDEKTMRVEPCNSNEGVMSRIGYGDYSYAIHFNSKTILRYDETHNRSEKNGLLVRTTPVWDAAELGFVGQLGDWSKAVAQHFAGDQAGHTSAMELALKVLNLQESIPNLQVEFIYPGHVWSGTGWQMTHDAFGAVPNMTSLYPAGVPTTSLAQQLVNFGSESYPPVNKRPPNTICPPSIMLTLPVYKMTPAKLRNDYQQREFSVNLASGSDTEMGKHTTARRIMLVPTASKPFNHDLNPDLFHHHCADGEIGITDRCNFGGKNDYLHRGKIVPLSFAHNPHSCVAFCLPNDTEYLDAYWTAKDKWTGKYQGCHDEQRYGWIEDIDVVLTRVGAMIAEHFFSTASGVSV